LSGTEYGLPFQIETKRLDGDAWEVSGYASTFDRDLGDDVVVPGAFQKSLSTGRPVRFLFGHDHRQPIGKTLELKEDERGLFGRFAISKTSLGADVRTLLRDGAIDSFSIGYLPKEAEVDKKAGVRKLKEVELIEVSVVSIPMNPAALVTGVKELDGNAIAQAVAAYVADAEATRRNRPLEAILEEAHGEVKALCERRRADWREPSDRTKAAVEAYRKTLLSEAENLAALLVPVLPKATEPAEAPVVPEPEAEAQPETDAPSEQTQAKAGQHSEAIERQRAIRRLLSKFADVTVPAPDPLAGLERLPVRDPLTGEVRS
jgi:HK97 family phage prohead protease